MSSRMPFYAEAAVLDGYARWHDPGSDPDGVERLLSILASRPDLRRHFFRSEPSAAWAPILWERGFFETHPDPEETEAGVVALPRWDVQEYLILVADSVPDVVLNHINTVDGPPWYISRALEALRRTAAECVVEVMPRLSEWVEDLPVAMTASEQLYGLVLKLAVGGYPKEAIALFEALTVPVSGTDPRLDEKGYSRCAAIAKFREAWNADTILQEGLGLLPMLHSRKVVMLSRHLLHALRLEGRATGRPDFEFRSMWRAAIEETGQDLGLDYKEQLVQALRGAMEEWAREEPSGLEPVLMRYMRDGHTILRRLAFHILQRFANTYSGLIEQELPQRRNLQDVPIHHEYFVLLERGFPKLN